MLVKALVLRPLVREKTRSALTLLGIAVGVAVVVAIALSNQSALRAFREWVDAVAGRANWQIAADAMLDEDLLLKLQPLWARGVRFAPVIDINGLAEPAQTPIRILAVDLLSDLHFRDYRYARVVTERHPESAKRDEGPQNATTSAISRSFTVSAAQDDVASLFQPDSVVLPASYGLKLNARRQWGVRGTRKEMLARAIVDPRGPATAFNGAIAIVDIAAAQASFGLRGKLSRIDLIVPHDDEGALAAIRLPLPPGARLERPSRRNERVE